MTTPMTIIELATLLGVTPADVVALVDQLRDIDGDAAVYAGPDPLGRMIDTRTARVHNSVLTPMAVEAVTEAVEVIIGAIDAMEVDVAAARTDIAATRHALRLALGLVGNQRSPYAPPTIADLEDDR